MEPINSVPDTIENIVSQHNTVLSEDFRKHLVTALTNRELAIRSNVYHGLGSVFPQVSIAVLTDVLTSAGLTDHDPEWAADRSEETEVLSLAYATLMSRVVELHTQVTKAMANPTVNVREITGYLASTVELLAAVLQRT